MKIFTYCFAAAAFMFGTLLACGEAEAHFSIPNTFYTFAPGEALTAEKLNTNFSHLHNSFNAGISNSNIAQYAAIAHSKLAQPTLIPKAVGGIAAPIGTGGNFDLCTGLGPCQLLASSTNLQAINRSSIGVYSVVLAEPLANADYTMFINRTKNPVAAGERVVCAVAATIPQTSLQSFTVYCRNHLDEAVDAAFNVVVYGN